MSEEQQKYTTDNQPAAIIDPPRNVTALRDGGLVEHKSWGWVKMSAKFIGHIRLMKGAKLAVWNVIALTISENGRCELSVAEIAELAGYSTSETRSTISELGEMGYMTVESKSGKRNIYSPEFVARAANNPTDRPLQETCTPPVRKVKCAEDPSSPSIENSLPSYRELKRVNSDLTIKEKEQANQKMDAILAMEGRAQNKEAALIEFESALSTPANWTWYPAKSSDEPAWNSLREFVIKTYAADPQAFRKYSAWRGEKYARGAMGNLAIKRAPAEFEVSYSDFLASSSMYGSKSDAGGFGL